MKKIFFLLGVLLLTSCTCVPPKTAPDDDQPDAAAVFHANHFDRERR